MKFAIAFLAFTILSYAYAKIESVSANDICIKASGAWVRNAEAEHTASKKERIQDLEKRSLGSGAHLYLMSIFVDGPKTGDNTHWEVVGEFELKSNSCKILLGRRYWAH